MSIDTEIVQYANPTEPHNKYVYECGWSKSGNPLPLSTRRNMYILVIIENYNKIKCLYFKGSVAFSRLTDYVKFLSQRKILMF